MALGNPVDARGVDGDTPLGCAVVYLTKALGAGLEEGCSSAAEAAAVKARYLDTAKCLLEAGADPNAAWGNARATPLLYACQGSPFGPLTEIIQALLEAGADPEQADAEGRTPLFFPLLLSQLEPSHQSVVGLLRAAIAAGARPRCGGGRSAVEACESWLLAPDLAAAQAFSWLLMPCWAPPLHCRAATPAPSPAAAPQRTCMGCGRTAAQLSPPERMQRCAGCRVVHFCCVECQTAAWPVRSGGRAGQGLVWQAVDP